MHFVDKIFFVNFVKNFFVHIFYEQQKYMNLKCTKYIKKCIHLTQCIKIHKYKSTLNKTS